MDKVKRSKLIEKYESLFIKQYKDIVSKKHSQQRLKFPIIKGFDVKVVTINHNEAVELIFILSHNTGHVSYSYVELEMETTEQLNTELKNTQKLEEHRQQVVDMLDLRDVIAHIIVFPPFEDQNDFVNE